MYNFNTKKCSLTTLIAILVLAHQVSAQSGKGCANCVALPDGSAKWCTSCYKVKHVTTGPNNGKCEGTIPTGCLYHGSTMNDGVSHCLLCEEGKMLVRPANNGIAYCEDMPTGTNYNCGQGVKTPDSSPSGWRISCSNCKPGDAQVPLTGYCQNGGTSNIANCQYTLSQGNTYTCSKCPGANFGSTPCPVADATTAMLQGTNPISFNCNVENGFFAMDHNGATSVCQNPDATTKKYSTIIFCLSSLLILALSWAY